MPFGSTNGAAAVAHDVMVAAVTGNEAWLRAGAGNEAAIDCSQVFLVPLRM